MSDFLYQLERVLLDNNIQIIGNIKLNCDKPQRFKERSKPNGGKNIFIILHGDKGASFGDWRYREGWQTWWMHGESKLTTQDRIDLQLQREALARARFKRQQFAMNRAQDFWYKYPASDAVLEHPYIKRKRIRPYFAKSIIKDRWIKDILMVPVRDIDYQLQTVQIIKPNGFKRVWKGTTYKENMIWLTPLLPVNYTGVIRLCEGYATGCTIYQIMGDAVICSLNAYNLPAVAKQLRLRYPKCHLKICADNDCWGNDNVGLNYAALSDDEGMGFIHYPDFSQFNTSNKPTDYNDLFVIAGEKETRRQLILIR